MLRRQILRQSRAVSDSCRAFPVASRPQLIPAPFLSRSTIPLSARQGQRWQSTEVDKKPPEESSPSTENSKPAEAKEEDPVKQELEKTKREVIDLKDKYLRSVADYRNLQERTRRDMESARQFALQRFATDLLDSLDNLDRALSSVPAVALGNTAVSSGSSDPANATPSTDTASEPNRDLVNLFSGLKMTEEILMATLKKHGLERFDPLEGDGRKFDPNTDEATFFSKVEGKQDGDVFFTQSKGFKLNGRVVRAAKVGVVKNS